MVNLPSENKLANIRCIRKNFYLSEINKNSILEFKPKRSNIAIVFVENDVESSDELYDGQLTAIC